MTVTATDSVAMTSCLPGADSGGSQGSMASLNESGASVTASPVLSPNEGSASGPNITVSSAAAIGLNFSASSLCHSAVTSTAAGQPASGQPGMTSPVGSENNNHLSAAAAAAAAAASGQLNLSDCDPARFAAAGIPYPRLSAASAGLGSMYSAAAAAATYPSNEQNPYPSIAMDNSFYGSLGNPSAPGAGDMSAWPSATALQPTGYYAGYDHPSLAAYGYGTGYDLASRRKNATRESTATLKAWLNEHKKNPYPTKGEKIMLAIITKMTLTQVSTWFANARRRLKKENKMTWEPKNKLDDEDVDVSDDDDKDRDDDKHDETDPRHHLGHLGLHHDSSVGGDSKSSAGIPIPPSKPKIWSLADTAVCKTPPPPSSAQNSNGQLHHGYQQQQPQPPQQPPHSQSYLHSAAGIGSAASAAWGHNFSQFVADPAMMRLRHHGNMLGMGYMAGLPPPPAVSAQQPFSNHLTAAAVASPGLNSDGVQSSNDTPPHTPPTLKSGQGSFGTGQGYNGLHNGYSQMSPSPNVGGSSESSAASAAAAAASKMLMFNSSMSSAASSFKMM